MSDTLTTFQRSKLMGRVRQHGTSIELLLRQKLWSAGLRYRLKTKEKLPGSPDLVFVRAKVAVFVDGCFWHGCPIHGTRPKTNEDFWAMKLSRNRERDAQVNRKLEALGWVPVRIWEHEVKTQLDECLSKVCAIIEARKA